MTGMDCSDCGQSTQQDGAWPGNVCLACWERKTAGVWWQVAASASSATGDPPAEY